MTQDSRVGEPGPRLRCLVCLKPIGPDEQRHTVHFRGSEHVVCCPSCVQAFNRSPLQFLEQP